MTSSKKHILHSCIAVFLVIAVSSCNHKKQAVTVQNSGEKETVTTNKEEPKVVIKYHLDSLKNKTQVDSFNNKYDSTQKQIIEALNRLSPGRIRLGSTVAIPDTFLTNWMQYSPFPSELNSFDTIPKLIVIEQRVQAFGAYENGKLVRWGPASTGRKAKPTPTGLLYTNYKAKLKISTIDGDWKMPWYFNIQNKSGIGMHQFLLPGYAASHSCIRLLERDAFWIFNWADQWVLTENGAAVANNGTPVIVFGNYGYGETPPWKKLPEDINAANLTTEDIATINSFLPQIKK
ncbi:MAG: protein containing ykud domain [Bacteroidota bacterium]|nr:protein containing ykud domain [Bacteroidota bacterium]